MKKLSLLSLMMLFCLPLAAYGAGIGGPPTGGQFKFNIGLDQDVVSDRDLKPSNIVVMMPLDVAVGCDIKRMYRSMLNVSFGVFDFLDVYVKLGVADYKFKADLISNFGFTLGDATLNTKWGFAYGGGLKGAYSFKEGMVKGLLIGADAQYLRHKQRYHAMIDSIMGPSDFTGHVTFQEWQVGPFVGYKIMNFLPYAGVKYSDVRLKFKQEGVTQKFKADDHVGAFVGLTYDLIPQVKLNLEGRFIDEYGMNFNVIFKF
jgi:opacity protein-like surface antigen